MTRDEGVHCIICPVCSQKSAHLLMFLISLRIVFIIPNWFKASTDNNEQLCHPSRWPCSQPPLSLNQLMLHNLHCCFAFYLRFNGILASWWDEITLTPQTVFRHREAVRVKLKPRGFLHVVIQLVINTQVRMLQLHGLIPCSQAIRTAAITQWSLLLSWCSWWYCSLGNDYIVIKTNVGFIRAEILGRYCVAIRHTICFMSLLI